MRAINRTLSGVRTDAVSEIRNQAPLKAKVVRDTMRIHKASLVDPSGKLESRGHGVPLIHYSARQTKKGVTFSIHKGGKRDLLTHAFIAAMRSGHRGVFTRQGLKKHATGKKPTPGVAYAALPRRYRLPIREEFGPAVPTIMGMDRVYKKIQGKAGKRLKKNFDHELKYLLSKL